MLTTTHPELLANLDPHDPLSIQALINFHKTAFGGWVMKDDDGTDDADKSDSEIGDGDDKETGDKPLGPNGEKALKSEREARKALETKIAKLESDQKSQMDRLAEAFGIQKDAKSKDTDTDVITKLQERLQGLERSNLLLTVAGEHEITDKDDLALLRDAPTEDKMRALAARLAKASGSVSDDGKGQGRKSPRSDPSQGKGGGKGSDSTSRSSSVAQVMADRRAAREAKK